MRRLLIVEDEPDVLDALVMALEDFYEIHTAPNGRRGLERLGAENFDAVIVDLMTPVLSGEEMIRALDGREHPPIIVASASRDLPRTCKGLGVRHWVQKPYPLEELLGKLDLAIAGQ